MSLPQSADPGVLALLDAREVRYEVLDGAVVVTPPARFSHERLVPRLAAALLVGAPPGLEVLGPNYAFRYAPGSFLLPDLLVARREDCDELGTSVAPLLVVEVLSPSTWRRDRGEKRAVYAESGVLHYWLVDPDGPSVTVHRLVDGRYEQQALQTAALSVSEPFEVRLDLPSD